MKAPLPSLTAEWHNTTYDAISPTRPELSAVKKTVVVTGAGTGIGRETIRAYAAAGAAHVALLGRTLATLSETQKILEAEFPSVKISTHVADTADEAAVDKAAAEIGSWDVLILNAGIAIKKASFDKTSVSDWWRVFEVCNPRQCQARRPSISMHHIRLTHFQTNVKGNVVAAHAFLPTRNGSAVIIGVTAGMVLFPSSNHLLNGSSAYVSSKLAQIRLLEYLAAENPDVFVVAVHPGVVETPLLKSMEAMPGTSHIAIDDGKPALWCRMWRAIEMSC